MQAEVPDVGQYKAGQNMSSTKISLDEEFGTPSRIPATADGIDLSVFDNNSRTAEASNLRAKSLYKKFDPLVDGADDEDPKEQAPSSGMEQMSLIDRAQKLLKRNTDPNERTISVTEHESLVKEALSQSEEEAMIVQMENDELRTKLAKEREQNAQMTSVMEEYSAEITKLMESRAAESESGQLTQLQLEKDQIEADLEKTETAFADLHDKYMKAKEVIDNYKKNEIVLKDAVQKGQLAINVAESRYNKLRSHAEEKIEEANKEIASVRETLQSQVLAAEMKLKTAEQEVKSMQRELALKVQDNSELTAICDELVNKLEGRA